MSTVTGERGLPAGLPDDVVAEIARFRDRLPAGASCLATGSLIEGLGNANSDIDLYVIPDPDQAAGPTSIGIRASRYVDCEYLTLDGIDSLVSELNRASPDEVARYPLRDFDRYYRLAIAVRLTVTSRAESLLRRCTRAHVCRLFGRWSLLRARERLARAAVAAALGDHRAAVILVREAADWRATGLLADQGEGYPSLKWVTVKAGRRFGPGTPGYHDCLDGFDTTIDTVGAAVPRLRERLCAELAEPPAEHRRTWALADRAEVLDDDVPLLMLGRRSIVRVPGLPGRIVTRLAEGRPWHEVVGRVAAELDLPPDDVRLASAVHLRELADLGYLVGGPDEGSVDVAQ